MDSLISVDSPSATLESVLAAVSEQCGVSVKAAPYLAERRLSVHFHQLPARHAVDALVTLYNWRWTRTDRGDYLVDRKTVRPPRDGLAVAQQAKDALPVDFARFLGVGVPREETAAYTAERPLAEGYSSGISRDPFIQRASVTGVNEALMLFNTLLPEIEKAESIPYNRIPREQQERLVLALTLRAIGASEHGVFLDAAVLPIYLHDLSKADLQVQDSNRLVVMGFTDLGNGRRSGRGFGGIPIPSD
jgi:hypothetical protein